MLTNNPVIQDVPYCEVSAKYKFVSTNDIKNYLIDHGYAVFKETSTCARKNVGYQKHCIKFVRQCDAQYMPVEGGGLRPRSDAPAIPMLILTNSHDGKSAVVLQGGFFRILCANGMVVSESELPSQRIRHNTNNIMEKIWGAAWKIVAELGEQAKVIEAMRLKKLNAVERYNLANAAIALLPNSTGINALDALTIQREGDETNDLWTVFNRVQEHIMKGGLAREGTRTRRTREVKSIDRELDLNAQLWDVAVEFLKAA